MAENCQAGDGTVMISVSKSTVGKDISYVVFGALFKDRGYAVCYASHADCNFEVQTVVVKAPRL